MSAPIPQIAVRGMARALADIEKGVQRMRGFGKVTVGIHKAQSSKGRKGDDPNNATLGAIHQFGTETIPARPWLDRGVLSASEKLTKHAANALKNGELPRRVSEQLGGIAAGAVQQYVIDLKEPPNAPSTIRQKKSANPLVDTGALVRSISYEVH